jgi:hypothetical protein
VNGCGRTKWLKVNDEMGDEAKSWGMGVSDSRQLSDEWFHEIWLGE